MRALFCLILATEFICCSLAHAKLNPTNDVQDFSLDNVNYVDIRPNLQVQLGSLGEVSLGEFNKAYGELKNSGSSNPSLRDVLQQARKNDAQKVAVDPLSICLLAAAVVVPAGLIGLRNVINPSTGGGGLKPPTLWPQPGCPNKVSQLIKNQKIEPSSLQAADASN